MSCPGCAFENPGGMKFCGEGGRALNIAPATADRLPCPGVHYG